MSAKEKSIYTQTHWRVRGLLWLCILLPYANLVWTPSKKASIAALSLLCAGIYLLAIALWFLTDKSMMSKTNRKKAAGIWGLSNATPRTLLLPIAASAFGIILNGV